MVSGEELLSPAQRAALEGIRKLPASYGVRLLVTGDEAPRLLVVIGETHVKLGAAARAGKALVETFELRGVETFPVRAVFAGRALSLLIRAPRTVLRALSLGLVKGSTITDAKEVATGHTSELERDQPIPLSLHVGSAYLAAFFVIAFLQVALVWIGDLATGVGGIVMPVALCVAASWLTLALALFELHMFALVPAWVLRKYEYAWLINPAIAILTARDVLMANGTARMLRDHPAPRTAVVIMGRAHLPGFTRELTEKHGMRSLSSHK